MTLRQELSALTLRHCLHACVFSFRGQTDNTFYELESRYDIFGTPGFTLFITRDWEFINLKITSWNSGPRRGAKHIYYKRLFRRRESIDTITPDSSFHQNFSI
jgi:hypothetical protein